MLRATSRAPQGSRLVLLALAVVLLLPGLIAFTPLLAGASEPHAASGPGTARTAAAENPLANRPWGVYRGSAEMVSAPYAASTGTERELLSRIALRPKAKWFGAWIPDDQVAGKVQEYIADSLASTGGNPETLVSMTIFRMVPWEQEACRRLPTDAEIASYRAWIAAFAGAVGSTHTMIVLQPDGPFALCAPGGSTVYSSLVAEAVQTLSALPATSVYIGAGAADWHRKKTDPAVRLLVNGGVAAARGFILNTTHYDSAKQQVKYGARVVAALAQQGITGKHFLVDTASNGRSFTGKKWRKMGKPGKRFDNAATCASATQTRCVTLGIPPTWQVDDPQWGLPEAVRQLAATYVDGFVWAGRPWLTNATAPFDKARALAVASTTPFAGVPVAPLAN
jgi:endoglucanase